MHVVVVDASGPSAVRRRRSILKFLHRRCRCTVAASAMDVADGVFASPTATSSPKPARGAVSATHVADLE
jgi:hypothetical protein